MIVSVCKYEGGCLSSIPRLLQHTQGIKSSLICATLRTVLEKEVLNSCRQYLELKGFLVVRHNNIGVFNKKSGGYFFHGQKGVSDLLCCSPKGIFVAVETKVKGKKPTPEQSAFLQRVNDLGGVGCWVTSIEDLEADLKEAQIL